MRDSWSLLVTRAVRILASRVKILLNYQEDQKAAVRADMVKLHAQLLRAENRVVGGRSAGFPPPRWGREAGAACLIRASLRFAMSLRGCRARRLIDLGENAVGRF